MFTQIAQRQEQAAMGSHAVIVQRLTGDGKSWVDAPQGALLAPGETIRLYTAPINYALLHTPVFSIIHIKTGNVVFQKIGAPVQSLGPIAGPAEAVTTAVPLAEASYRVEVSAQSFPLFPKTHLASTTFVAVKGAPAPPFSGAPGSDTTAPPKGFLDEVKFLALVVLGIVALSAFSTGVSRVLPKR